MIKWFLGLFHFHTWTKWNKIDEGDLVDVFDNITGSFTIQERTCVECGLVEEKTFRAY